jgi:hypothetical protein
METLIQILIFFLKINIRKSPNIKIWKFVEFGGAFENRQTFYIWFSFWANTSVGRVPGLVG